MRFAAPISLAFYILASCGKQSNPQIVQIPSAPGTPGSAGPQGIPGRPALSQTITMISVAVTRTYNPDGWKNFSDRVPAGVWMVPEDIVVAKGSVGGGWLGVQVGDVTYCYQGKGDPDHTSDTLHFQGIKGASSVCDPSNLYPSQRSFTLAASVPLQVTLTGGYCGKACTETEVILKIDGSQFNL